MCLDNPSAAQKAEFQSEIEEMKAVGITSEHCFLGWMLHVSG